MSQSAEFAAIEMFAYPVALGAGVAYSLYGRSLLPIAIGGAVGGVAYFPMVKLGSELPLPHVIRSAVPEILAGGLVGYNMYGGDLTYAAMGAAIGVGVKYAMVQLVSGQIASASPASAM